MLPIKGAAFPEKSKKIIRGVALPEKLKKRNL
jgi:hypothetical protein